MNLYRKEGISIDIAGLDAALSTVQSYDSSSSVSTGSLAYAVGVKMLDQSMEMNEAMNQQMVQMMENSVTPNLGGNIDTYV